MKGAPRRAPLVPGLFQFRANRSSIEGRVGSCGSAPVPARPDTGGSTVRKIVAALFLLIVVCASPSAAAPAGPSGAVAPAGFRALSGPAAAAFLVPPDVRVAWSALNPSTGIAQVRYQQYVGAARVYGGQLTVLSRGGAQVAVIGSHYPALEATNGVRLTPSEARAAAARDVGSGGRWLVALAISPSNGRLFYIVENRRFDSRWIHWIDAGTGV